MSTENPVCAVRSTTNQEGVFQYKSVYTFCPGCEIAHPFRIELGAQAEKRRDGSLQPLWTWDGDLALPTFDPSMLCMSSVHLCKDEHVPLVCENYDECERTGHLILNSDWETTEPSTWVYAHNTPHSRDPAWGNCHSFLRNGVWEFLGDSAHHLAGHKVPMVPLPDWLA